MQKWVTRWVDNHSGPVSRHDERPKFSDQNLATDIAKQWDEYRTSLYEPEKAAILRRCLTAFCSLLEKGEHSPDHIRSLVDVHQFSLALGRLFVEEVVRLGQTRTEGSLVIDVLVDYLSSPPSPQEGLGPVLLSLTEHLVQPGLDHSGLLESGVLGALVGIFHDLSTAPPPAEALEHRTVVWEPTPMPSPASTMVNREDGVLWLQVQERVEQLVKALACEPGAATRLVEDESLSKLFRLVGAEGGKEGSPGVGGGLVIPSIDWKVHRSQAGKVLPTPFLCPKREEQAGDSGTWWQILHMVLESDSGGAAAYLRKHKLMEVLLKVVTHFDVDSGDDYHTLSALSLLVECLRLSTKPDAGSVELKEDLKAMRGYFWITQLALKLTFAPNTQLQSPTGQLSPRFPLPSHLVSESSLGAGGPSPASTLSRSVSQASSVFQTTAPSPAPAARKGGGLDTAGSLVLWGKGAGGPGKVECLDRATSLSISGPGMPSGALETMSEKEEVGVVGPALLKLVDEVVVMAQVGRWRGKEEEFRILDTDAVQILQNVFLQTRQVSVQMVVLERLQDLFAKHADNYSILEDLKPLPSFIRGMHHYPPALQKQLLGVLQGLTPIVVPKRELLALCAELDRPVPAVMAEQTLAFAKQVIEFETEYRNVFRDVGLLDILMADLLRCTPSVSEGGAKSRVADSSISPPTHAHYRRAGVKGGNAVSYLFGEEGPRGAAWECLVELVTRSRENQEVLRQTKVVGVMMGLLSDSLQRAGVLRVLHCLICEGAGQELGALIAAVKEGSVEGGYRLDTAARTEVLWALWKALSLNPSPNPIQETFLKLDGFALLTSLPHFLRNPEPTPEQRGGWYRRATESPPLMKKVSVGVGMGMGMGVGQLSEKGLGGEGEGSGQGSGRGLEEEPSLRGEAIGGIAEEEEVEERYTRLSDVLANVAGPARPLLHSSEGVVSPFKPLRKAGGMGGGRLAGSGGSIQPSYSPDALVRDKMELLDALCQVLIGGVKNQPLGRQALSRGLRPKVVKAVAASGLMGREYQEKVVGLFFDLATETLKKPAAPARRSILHQRKKLTQVDQELATVNVDAVVAELMAGGRKRGEVVEALCVYNPSALQLVVELLDGLHSSQQLRVLVYLERLGAMSHRNQAALTGCGVVGLVLNFLKPHLARPHSPLAVVGLHVIEQLGTFRLSSPELRLLGASLRPTPASPSPHFPTKVLAMLEKMACADERSALGPFLHLSMGRLGYASLTAPLGDRPWPPLGGYSFSCWIRFQGLRGGGEVKEGLAPVLRLLSIGAEDKAGGGECYTQVSIGARGWVTLSTGPSSSLDFSTTSVSEGVWHHVVVLFTRPTTLGGLFQSSTASLWVDGQLQETGKLGHSTAPAGKPLKVVLGTSREQAQPGTLSWQLGGACLFEEVLPPPALLLIYVLGRGYLGTFQDEDLGRWIPTEVCTGPNLMLLEQHMQPAAGGGSAGGVGGLWSRAEEVGSTGGEAADGSRVTWEGKAEKSAVHMLQSKKMIFKFDGTAAEMEVATVLARSVVNQIDHHSGAASSLGSKWAVQAQVGGGWWVVGDGWWVSASGWTDLPPVAELGGDIQICTPTPLPVGLRKVGGITVILGLLEVASSQEALHLTLSLLASCLRNNARNEADMQRKGGYHLLGLLLYQRMPLLGMEGLDLLLQMAATDTKVDTGGGEEGEEVWHTSVLSNADVVQNVLLDWTIWVRAPVSLQLALLAFLERTIDRNRYQRHNLAMLRRLSIVETLLLSFQRGDLEGAVVDRIARLLCVVLEDGFLKSELRHVVDFVAMTFKASSGAKESGPATFLQRKSGGSEGLVSGVVGGGWRGGRGKEGHNTHVIIRNTLLEMLLKLEGKVGSTEHVATWHTLVTTEITAVLLNEEVHVSTLKCLLLLLSAALQSYPPFAAKFKAAGGFQTLQAVLPHFCEEGVVYYVLLATVWGDAAFPRLCSIKSEDLYALLARQPADVQHDLPFPDLLDCVAAALKAAYCRQAEGTGRSTQTAASDTFKALMEAQFGSTESGSLAPPAGAQTFLQGQAVAPAILRFLKDAFKMSPSLAAAAQRNEFLEKMVEVYFAGVKAGGTLLVRRARAAAREKASKENEMEERERWRKEQGDRRWSGPLSPADTDPATPFHLTLSRSPGGPGLTLEKEGAIEGADMGTPIRMPLPQAGTMSLANMLAARLGNSSVGDEAAPPPQTPVADLFEDQVSDVEDRGGGGLTSELIRKVDAGSEEVFGVGGAPAMGDLLSGLAEVVARSLVEVAKGAGPLGVVLDAPPAEVCADASLAFQGLFLTRLMAALSWRLAHQSPGRSLLPGSVPWVGNMEVLTQVAVDRVYLGAFMGAGRTLAVLHFLTDLLRLATAKRVAEERGTWSRKGGNPQLQTMLKHLNRLLMYSFLPPLLMGVAQEQARVEGGGGEGALSDTSLDQGAALQCMLESREVVLGPSNSDTELLACLLHNLTIELWAEGGSAGEREVVVEVCRMLVVQQGEGMAKLLSYHKPRGGLVDVMRGGFELLKGGGSEEFLKWVAGAREEIQDVLDQRASCEWMEFTAAATKFPGVAIKALEHKRKKEGGRREREVRLLSLRHVEVRVRQLASMDACRRGMAVLLRHRRQERYGWVLHAQTAWQGYLQQLVHERGLWPIWGGADCPVQWQLGPTEGLFRMRTRLVRCEVRVELGRAGGVSQRQTGLPMAPSSLQRSTMAMAGREESSVEGDEFLKQLKANQVGAVAGRTCPARTFSQLLDKELLESLETELMTVAEGGEQVEEAGAGKAAESLGRGGLRRRLSAGTESDFEDDFYESNTQSPPREAVGGGRICVDLTTQGLLEGGEEGEYLIRPHLLPGEKIKFKYNCERVVGLDKRDGVFLIGDLALYVIANYYLDQGGRVCEKVGENEASVLDQALGLDKDPYATPKTLQEGGWGWKDTAAAWRDIRASEGGLGDGWAGDGPQVGVLRGGGGLSHECRTWKVGDVHEVVRRRYQLRPVALEVFSMNGNNDLLVFHRAEREVCLKNITAMGLPRNSMLDSTISGGASVRGEGAQLFRRMVKNFGTRWQAGEISNFQYLMHLNTLAGRGYNDLTQYPVFPWVLADYTAAHLDLTNPNTFRQLNKPMGCLTAQRQEEFRKRYESWDDPAIPKFHYGSHYSSAGIVLYYLLRLPPFSQQNQQLQGGQFDHGDRLFCNLGETYKSASSGHTADVKELTPEFFYMPEILENRFQLDMGAKQSGEQVGDVVLPPWANGSAREFVRKHREALESQYVSDHLHEWINLIFGYQQSGEEAVRATNVFFYLTYEEAVNIDSIHDPATKKSFLAQINHFGQTPRQLFLKPHPQRKKRQVAPRAHVLRNCDLLVAEEKRTPGSLVGQIVMVGDKLGVLGANMLMKPPVYDKVLQWGYPDGSLRMTATDAEKGMSTHEGLHDDGAIQCADISQDGNLLATGGDDGVVAVWKVHADDEKPAPPNKLELMDTLCAHSASITALAICLRWSFLVSGSDDHTVIYWDLNSMEFVRQLPDFPAAITAVHANEMTGCVVTAAGSMLGVWSINGDCLAAINTAQHMAESITALATPTFSEWIETRWCVTGHRNGAIKIWYMEAGPDPPSRQAVAAHGGGSIRRMSSLGKGGMAQGGMGGMHKGHASSGGSPSGADLRAMAEEILAEKDMERERSPFTFVARRAPEWRMCFVKELTWHTQTVTALFLTPDLQQLFSGDMEGHVANWALPEGSESEGEAAESEPPRQCWSCSKKLSARERAWERKCHCSNCGRLVCGQCSENKIPLEELGHAAPVRVCNNCFEIRNVHGTAGARGLYRGASLAVGMPGVLLPTPSISHSPLPLPRPLKPKRASTLSRATSIL